MLEFSAAESRATEVTRLREAESLAWEQLDLIPLATEPRSAVIDQRVKNVAVYTGPAGIGWNMDRWYVEEQEQEQSEQATDGSEPES